MPAAARRRVPLPALALLVAAFLALSLFAGAMLGVREAGFAETLRAIPDGIRWAASPEFAEHGGAGELSILIGHGRIPRTVLAALAGACLGAAGALIQGHTRNPLADPGLLGVNAGAAAAVAAAVFLGWASDPASFVVPAFAGALAATALILALSSSGPLADGPVALVLAGMAVGAALMAVVNILVLHSSTALDAMRDWATGSVAGRDLSVAAACAVPGAAALLLALALGRPLNLLGLGEDVARSLGAPVRLYRAGVLLAVSLLGAVAVACAGPVSFIGLAAPHMTRALAGADYRAVIPAAMVVGAGLAVWADVLGRVIARPGELAMGVVLAIVGVPFFVWLVRSGRVRGAL
ncbi:FecCD family ABC transporter permease [Corynebacterium sp. 335C]